MKTSENLSTFSTAESARADFERDGFCFVPPIIAPDLLARAAQRMHAVMNCEYETGIAPHRFWYPGDDPTQMCKIDHAHCSDSTLYELVSQPSIGEWAAAITGAKMIQLWAVQMLIKPPSAEGASLRNNIGLHQDQQYWKDWWDGEVFTCWVAVSDVREESGPMRFIPGSQRWGLKNVGDFFGGETDRERLGIEVPEGEEWREVPAILPPGAASFHHRLTYHGSGPNLSQTPRLSFALHLRTENSRPVAGMENDYVSRLNDPSWAPVLYQVE